jgi:hypothetical protein
MKYVYWKWLHYQERSSLEIHGYFDWVNTPDRKAASNGIQKWDGELQEQPAVLVWWPQSFEKYHLQWHFAMIQQRFCRAVEIVFNGP